MSACKTGWRVVALGTLVSLFAAWCVGASTRGQDKPDAGAKKAGEGLTRLYFGAREGCAGAGCHTTPPDKGAPLLCRCTEFPIWEKEDKHAQAYKVLQTDRARRMGELLHYEKKVSDAAACLSCHAVVVENDKYKDKSFRLDEGVNCGLCHGPYEEWVGLHAIRVGAKWRSYDRAYKEEHFGMKDLWDPVKRSALCADCHVGNIDPKRPLQVKFVTHEMYASGHPPLPGFDAAAFSDDMPRHWEYRREKREEVQKRLGYDGKEQEQTKLVLAGAAVSLNTAMSLLARQAEECGKAESPDKRMLDYAAFDCYACHHDLRSTTNWRQKRGYVGKPGRPTMAPWPTALIRLAVLHAANDDAEAAKLSNEFAEKMKRVHAGFDAKPFGDVDQIAPAAADLAKWAAGLAAAVNAKECDAAAAKKLLSRLPQLYKDEIIDFDSARQIGWAFRTIYHELYPKPDKEIEDVLASLDRQLKLHLRPVPGRSSMEELEDGLKRLNEYDADQFQKSLNHLGELLRKH